MPPPPKATPALHALSKAERSTVLEQLLAGHPELIEDAEAMAADLLTGVRRAAVADELVAVLLAVPFTAIADRVGKQPGRGYVEAAEAASEVLEERLEPFLDDLRRTAAGGFADAATELGLGLLVGLYRLRQEAGPDTLIGWGAPDQEAWELATSVVLAFDDAGLQPAREVIDALVPDWAGIA
ncbi:MAG TPA: hypothetical protein VM324_02960 [Egibacteraceae bacterium]|nr:hypothetical protein [Egibacteraceae bacterium]